jgi:hypothetical protein
MPGPYTVTIYSAMPGTPLIKPDGSPDGTSAAGHMWYQLYDGQHADSFGFAPKQHGASSGPGKGFKTDSDAYQNPHFSRTMEISPEQYTKLRAFGEAAVREDWRYFRGDYNGATNSCVDFTWGALKHAGFQVRRPEVSVRDGTVVTPAYRGPIETHFEGRLKPGHNKVDIEQVVAPLPGSPLNAEKSNPPPGDRSLLQHLLSDNGTPTPAQRETAQRFEDQLGQRLTLRGMDPSQVGALAAAAAKEQTRYADHGEVQSFYLSKDGSTVAMRQAYGPLREFDVGAALGRSEQSHWSEAAMLERSRAGGAVALREGPGTPFLAQPVRASAAPVPSRG